MAIVAEQQFEPFLGKSVHGNILDQVDNYQYNVKFYMIPPIASPNGSANTTSDVSDERAVGPPKPGPSGEGGYLNNRYTAPPQQTVVLAQTGVTGAQLDNLEITTAIGKGGAFHTSTINFDIIQPGAADFMDQIIAAKAYLGDEINQSNSPLFLEIVFKGYSADVDDEDLGGKPILVSGPHRHRITIKSVQLEIDEEGSKYAFQCVAVDAMSYNDAAFRIPKKMESIGTTIDEHVNDLVKKIKEHNAENNDAAQIQDEIHIDTSGLSSGKYAIKDMSLTTSSDTRAEEINRIMNPELEGKTEDEYEDILKENTKDEGSLDIVVDENRVTVRENVTIERYLATLLSMNDEFFAMTSRAVNPEDPADTKVDKAQSLINWFKINGAVKYLAYDRKRNTYAKANVYKPVIYGTAKDTVQAKVTENANLTGAEVQSRLDGIPIWKAYHYLFTGLNDQILNARIEYKAGIAILAMPAGGVSGDFSTVMAKALSNSAGPNEDLTNRDLATAAVSTASEEDSENLVNSLFADSSPERESDIKRIADQLGFNPAEAADAIRNKNGLNAQIIKESLKNKTSAAALANAQQQQSIQQTTSDNSRNPDGTDYTPALSGTVYAADIIGSVSDRLEQAGALEAAQTRAEELRAGAITNTFGNKSIDPKQSSGVQPAIQVMSVPNQAEDATYNGTPRNTIFGYMMQQHGMKEFLVKMDIEIKGDPWYLGPPSADHIDPERSGAEDTTDETGADGIRFAGDSSYILFDLQTPRRFDFNTDDEDANTGYWSKMGTAYFITGIYEIVSVVSVFSGGTFTQELQLIKQTATDLKKNEKQAETTESDT
jgi:hypothetical protein